MIRLILDKVDDTYILDILDTRQSSHVNIKKSTSFKEIICDMALAAEAWRKLGESS